MDPVTEDVLTRPAPEPDVVVAWGPGPEDVAEVQLGGDDRPLVVLVHGGFWRPAYDRRHLRAMSHALAAEGWSAAAIEYRRVPGDPDASLNDVRVALRVVPVELRGRHDGRVVVVGHSAGGHLALWAASVAPASGLAATVALAPVADLAAADRELLGSGAVRDFLGDAASSRLDLDPVRMVSAVQPVTLVHGGDDESVPARQSQAYVDAHPTARLTLLDGVGHLDLIDPRSAAWPEVVRAIAEALEPHESTPAPS
jgi:acetyl esterase/lipase